MYTEFTKMTLFEQLSSAVACSASHGSREVSISECDVTCRRVKVDRYGLPATTIHAISHVTFPAFYFSIVYEALFSTSGSILYFTDDKTTNYLCIYMELSFRPGPPYCPPCYVAF